MRISTRGRYAIAMMSEFAAHGDKPMTISEVSKNQHISIKYLEQIVSILSKAGLVRSIRGAHGGYLLTKPATEYSLGEILRLTEGSLAPAECMDEGSAPCANEKTCITRYVFDKIEKAVNDVVDNISLQDLLDNENAGASASSSCNQIKSR